MSLVTDLSQVLIVEPPSPPLLPHSTWWSHKAYSLANYVLSAGGWPKDPLTSVSLTLSSVCREKSSRIASREFSNCAASTSLPAPLSFSQCKARLIVVWVWAPILQPYHSTVVVKPDLHLSYQSGLAGPTIQLISLITQFSSCRHVGHGKRTQDVAKATFGDSTSTDWEASFSFVGNVRLVFKAPNALQYTNIYCTGLRNGKSVRIE